MKIPKGLTPEKKWFELLKLTQYNKFLPETYEETINSKGEYSSEYKWIEDVKTIEIQSP